MALSNIFNDPGKELLETAVGVAVVLPPIGLDYLFAVWFQRVTGGWEAGCPWPIGLLFIGPVAAGAIIMLLFFIHRIGEETLDRIGTKRARR